jgi:Zn-dependent M28 family amino/carboxypeptidase
MTNWFRIIAAVVMLVAAGRQAAPPASRVDAAEIFHDVEKLASDDMEGRQVGSPGGRKAREYVIARLREAGVAPAGGRFEHSFTFTTRTGKTVEGVNVIGVLPGTRDPGHYIVVTAHYDHIGIRGGQVFNGADDNASGVATLLAAASHFSRARPEHSLLLAALDGEEAGLQGAKALMRDPPVPAAAMIVDVNVDMVGRDPENRLFAVGTRQYPYLRPYLEGIAQPPVVLAFGHDAPGHHVPGKEQDWTEDSDHFVFREAGIPFVYFGVEDFDQHHKATDDSATIGREFLAGAAATVIAAIGRFDAHLEQIGAERSKK